MGYTGLIAQARERDDQAEPVLHFAADGMRQDLIEKYTKDRRWWTASRKAPIGRRCGVGRRV